MISGPPPPLIAPYIITNMQRPYQHLPVGQYLAARSRWEISVANVFEQHHALVLAYRTIRRQGFR